MVGPLLKNQGSKYLDLENQWVVVTGASSGLGEAIARQLARDFRAKLILLARREDKLLKLKSELEQGCGCTCEVIVADLSDPSQYPQLFTQLSQYKIHSIILNAGITFFDEDLNHAWCDFETMMHTNVHSVVYFTRAFLQYFDERKIAGAVLVVGSIAGLVPVPYQAAYSGSKAFLTHYCQALQQEISRKNYSLSLFAPGGIDTEMNHASGLALTFSDSVFVQSVESCAEDALNTMIKRKALFVPRFSNRLQVLLVKLLPRTLTNGFTATTYRKALRNKNSKG